VIAISVTTSSIFVCRSISIHYESEVRRWSRARLQHDNTGSGARADGWSSCRNRGDDRAVGLRCRCRGDLAPLSSARSDARRRLAGNAIRGIPSKPTSLAAISSAGLGREPPHARAGCSYLLHHRHSLGLSGYWGRSITIMRAVDVIAQFPDIPIAFRSLPRASACKTR